MSSRTYFRKYFPFIVSVLLLVYVFHDSSFNSLRSNFRNASISWLTLYFLMALFEPILRGLRWHCILNSNKMSTAISGMFISKAGNNLLPFRLGDAIRAEYINDKSGIPYSTAITSFIAEAFIDLLFLSIFAIYFSYLWRRFFLVGIIILCSIVTFVCVILTLSKSHLIDKYHGESKILLLLIKIFNSITTTLNLKNILPVFLSSLLLWCYTYFMTYAALKMILPDVTFSGTIATILFTYLIALIPSAPGLVGTYHVAIVSGIAVMGYSVSDYPSVAILAHLLQYIPQTIVGIILGSGYLFRKDWSKVRNIFLNYFRNENNAI